MKRIVWVADYNVEQRHGGAQLTNQAMIEHGKKLGLTIEELTAKDLRLKKNRKIDKDAFYIINNYVVIHNQNKEFLEELVNSVSYSRYIHDYDWVYPKITGEFIDMVFAKAQSVIYLSPLHKQLNEIKQFRHQTTMVIPSPIDVNYFVQTGIQKKPGSVIYSGEINTHKGLHNVYNYALFNSEKLIDLYGWIQHPSLIESLPSNVKYCGVAENKSMADLYSQYESVIHMPVWHEPFGRSVAEAYLCGCDVITNSRVGFMSYNWGYNDREAVRREIMNAPTTFWDHIQKFL